MIIYECNMLIGDQLIIPLLHISPHARHEKWIHEGALVNINIRKIFCVWCNKRKVKCVDVLCEDKKINWNEIFL